MNMNIIEIAGLVKMYKKEEVFRINTFSFLRGKSYLLLGENGSGKSTLIKMIVGLIRPNSGIIKLNSKNISYVPERLIFPDYLSVYEFLLLLCKVNRNDENISKIKDLCNEWELDLNKKIYKLSKGNKQKILIVQALLKSSDLYVFDEALNGLDIRMQEKLINTIKKLTIGGKSVIVSTHYKDYFIDKCDYVIRIKNKELNVD